MELDGVLDVGMDAVGADHVDGSVALEDLENLGFDPRQVEVDVQIAARLGDLSHRAGALGVDVVDTFHAEDHPRELGPRSHAKLTEVILHSAGVGEEEPAVETHDLQVVIHRAVGMGLQIEEGIGPRLAAELSNVVLRIWA